MYRVRRKIHASRQLFSQVGTCLDQISVRCDKNYHLCDNVFPKNYSTNHSMACTKQIMYRVRLKISASPQLFSRVGNPDRREECSLRQNLLSHRWRISEKSAHKPLHRMYETSEIRWRWDTKFCCNEHSLLRASQMPTRERSWPDSLIFWRTRYMLWFVMAMLLIVDWAMCADLTTGIHFNISMTFEINIQWIWMQFKPRADAMIQDENSAFSPDQSVLNFCSAATRRRKSRLRRSTLHRPVYESSFRV